MIGRRHPAGDELGFMANGDKRLRHLRRADEAALRRFTVGGLLRHEPPKPVTLPRLKFIDKAAE